MLITIYDSVGNPKVDLSPNDSSTQVKEVQGDSVLTLSFTHYEHIELDVDDYTDFLGERFWLTEKYRPRQNSKMEWVYDLKLYGVESMIKRLLVIKTVDNEEEPVFTLTAPPREHVAMIVKCMNDGMGNITDWKVGQVNGTENIVIDYFGKYCDEALKEIAEKVGAEWWVEGQTVNICKCEHGEPVELGYDKGLLSIDPGTADNVKFYTRLYPVGSSRNIDREKYGFTRLQLPGGQKYVEINADKYGRVDQFEQSAFEDIYPRRVGVVSSVRSEVKTGEDGNPFTIYYFTDNSLPFDPNDYMIGGLVIRVSFQEGSELAGLGEEDNGTYFFEVNFNSTTREFEIITIWPYDNDIQLPGDKLVPKAGDRYILWNLSMPDEYYALAEEEFLTAVNKYNADHNLDISVYKAPTDHVWIEDNNVELSIGRRVRLVSEEYFPGFGFRDSRITKITRKVNLPSSMDIEISDALSRTAQEKMADSITDVRSFAQSIQESHTLPDIIRTGDSTKPTDNNLLSALRVYRSFLRKDKSDRTPYDLTVGRDLSIGDYIRGFKGAQVDRSGNGEFESLTSRSYLKIYELIYNRLNALEGEYSFCDSATIESVRRNPDGTYALSLRKRWDGDFNAFQYGDIVYGFVNDLRASGVYAKAWGNVVGVERGESNGITVRMYADQDVPGNHNALFTGGMVIARHGNSVTPNASTASAFPAYIHLSSDGTRYINDRQSSFFISAPDGCIKYLHGVDSPVVVRENLGMILGRMPQGMFADNPAIEQIAADGMPRVYARGIITQEIIRTDYRGLTIKTQNFRGEWNADTAADATRYYVNNNELYDTVTHDGILYQCVVTHTTAMPDLKNPECGWLPITDHRELDIWSVEASADFINSNPNSGALVPPAFSVWARVSSSGGTVDVRDSADLYNDYGMQLFVDGAGGAMRDESGNALEDEDGDAYNDEQLADIFLCGEEYESEYYPNGVKLALVDLKSGEVIARKTISVVEDGKNGKDGENGKDGSRGPMAYPAGVYDSTVGYDASGSASPIVQYGSQYFILKEGKTWAANQTTTPAQDSVSADPSWELVDKFNTVFTDILMANFAKLSEAVFYGDYMFSAKGASSAGVSNSAYHAIDTYLDMLEGKEEWGTYTFKPNFLLNLRTGQMWCDDITAGNTVFSGHDISDAAGVYGSFEVTKGFSGPFQTQRTNVTRPDRQTPTVVAETELVAFSLRSEAKVKVETDGTARSVKYSGDTSLRLTSYAKLVYQLYKDGVAMSGKRWEVLADDGDSAVPNGTTVIAKFPQPMELTLGAGNYSLKASAELNIYLTYDLPDGAITKTGYTQVSITKAEVYVTDDYKSLYGRNGFLLGTSPQNYVMAVATPNKGMHFIAENSKGFGLRVDDTGIKVKDTASGNVWKTLEEYVKLIIKTNN